MIKNKFNFTIVLIIFTFSSILWSTRIYFDLGTDFGQYLTGSIFLNNDDYKLYTDHFDNKGPVFYLFLKFTFYLSSFDFNKVIIPFILALFVYFIPQIYFINKLHYKNKLFSIMLYAVLLATLFEMNVNSIIFFFTNGLLFLTFIFSYYLIQEKVVDKKNIYFILALIFFWLACNSIVTSLIFFPAILFIFFYKLNEDKIFSNKIVTSVLFLFIPIIIYFIIQLFLQFNFEDYIKSNILFNLEYKYNDTQNYTSFLFNLNRKDQFYYFLATGIIFLFFQILMSYYEKISFKKFKLFKNTQVVENFSLLICILGLILVVGLNINKSYYALLFVTPVVFSSIILKKYFDNKFFKISIILISFYTCFLVFGSSFSKVIFKNECIKNIICEKNQSIVWNEIVIDEDTKSQENLVIIGPSYGWPYVYLKKKPAGSIINSFLYNSNYYYKNSSMLKLHKRIISDNNIKIFWINNTLLQKKNNNFYLNELIKNSEELSRKNYFTKMKFN